MNRNWNTYWQQYNHVKINSVSELFKRFRLFFYWRIKLKSKNSSLTDGIPWITFESIEFLNKKLDADMKVFEYGSGGSSIYFAGKVDEVISIEHDESWYKDVASQIRTKSISNWKGYWIPAQELDYPIIQDVSDPDQYASLDDRFNNRYIFKEYASAIERYPAGYFDIVMIDGRARPSCIKHALNKVKERGYLILDNSDREYYLIKTQQIILEHGFKLVLKSYGPVPHHHLFATTSIYIKHRQHSGGS